MISKLKGTLEIIEGDLFSFFVLGKMTYHRRLIKKERQNRR